jgi:hypothetical protein
MPRIIIIPSIVNPFSFVGVLPVAQKREGWRPSVENLGFVGQGQSRFCLFMKVSSTALVEGKICLKLSRKGTVCLVLSRFDGFNKF